MKVKITAGTHIGIRGCYGEKIKAIPGINTEKEVRDFLLKEFDYLFNIPYTWKRPGWCVRNPIYTFIDKSGCTILEYYYKIME